MLTITPQMQFDFEVVQNVVCLLCYTPRNEVVGGYTGSTLFIRPSVDKSYVVR